MSAVSLVNCSHFPDCVRAEEKMEIFMDMLSNITPVCIGAALAAPVAFPSDWLAFSAPLGVVLAAGVLPIISANTDLIQPLLAIALMEAQIPSLEDLEVNPDAFYGMAYREAASALDLPRQTARSIFQQIANSDPAVHLAVCEWINDQDYSEGLMFLVKELPRLPEHLEYELGLVRKFAGLDLPPFDSLTRLRALIVLSPRCSDEPDRHRCSRTQVPDICMHLNVVLFFMFRIDFSDAIGDLGSVETLVRDQHPLAHDVRLGEAVHDR
jgi:hypothetical protein